jgi:hypothetical protein
VGDRKKASVLDDVRGQDDSARFSAALLVGRNVVARMQGAFFARNSYVVAVPRKAAGNLRKTADRAVATASSSSAVVGTATNGKTAAAVETAAVAMVASGADDAEKQKKSCNERGAKNRVGALDAP